MQPRPWIDPVPEVPERSLAGDESHPPDCPDEQRKRVFERVSRTHETGKKQAGQDCEKKQAGAAGDNPDVRHSPKPDGPKKSCRNPRRKVRKNQDGQYDHGNPRRDIDVGRQKENERLFRHVSGRRTRNQGACCTQEGCGGPRNHAPEPVVGTFVRGRWSQPGFAVREGHQHVTPINPQPRKHRPATSRINKLSTCPGMEMTQPEYIP